MPWDHLFLALPTYRRHSASIQRFDFDSSTRVTMTPFFGVTKLSKNIIFYSAAFAFIIRQRSATTFIRFQIYLHTALHPFAPVGFSSTYSILPRHQFLRGGIYFHYYGNDQLLLSGLHLYLCPASTPDPSRRLRLNLFHFVLAPTYIPCHRSWVWYFAVCLLFWHNSAFHLLSGYSVFPARPLRHFMDFNPLSLHFVLAPIYSVSPKLSIILLLSLPIVLAQFYSLSTIRTFCVFLHGIYAHLVTIMFTAWAHHFVGPSFHMAFYQPIPLNHSAFIWSIQIIRPCPGLHHLHIRHFYFCQIMYFPELATVRSTAISDQDVILLRRGPWFSLKHLVLYAEISYIEFFPIQWHIIVILTLPFQLDSVQMSSHLLAHLLELSGASSTSAGLVF